jgi:ssDNA-binding replication factor A large subunit
MEFEELKNKIIQETNLTKDELEERIEEKIVELSNLVSPEGAAYIIAKEEGLDLLEKRDRSLKIKNVIPKMKNVEVIGKIIEISEMREFDTGARKGKVQNVVIGDETGKIRVTFWNDKTDLIKDLKEGDVIRVRNGYTKANIFGIPEIHMGKGSNVIKEKIDIEVKDIPEKKSAEIFKTLVDRKFLKDLKENDFVEVKAAVVSTFENEYITCPECNSKIEKINDSFVCNDHGKVEPKKNLIVKGYLDDGTATFRFVSFKEVAEKIKNFEGKDMIYIGRIKKNEYFGDLEMIINDVKELNVEEEIEKLI